ncbi:hypothetical protein EHQ12_17645 [Leptospira gomenensis]|uniref:Uncharacterized protein n=1 Tax=Leptospira gomenensis TaxID=2484974 RepID=A0A5F1Y7S9_9LEPT|nr:PcfJ domain-containing protein [Leptospira gomenensis]TGK29421.1 hypothetical protein EHQ17_15690 [Leptospira gomenensis]TGK33676.1 hypothetical protein EHQ12_17645 [Leptospira gomenensis]TGK44917.1 hypothetical protein EHQ07_11600 [Leptospira gomenensis]TGK64538.1 hypothetical protein EHQ13_07685 [Leptospira gomenensis]
MIRALEYCMEYPHNVFEHVPEDFETIRSKLPHWRRKEIARYFGFDPGSIRALEKITEQALLAGHLTSFQRLYSDSIYRNVFHHVPILNEFLFEFLLCAYRKGWNRKWDILLLNDIVLKFPDDKKAEEEPAAVFSIYEELKRKKPEKRIRSVESLYRAERKLIQDISEKGFTGIDRTYPPPPIGAEEWMNPIETRKELFLESVSQHNCVFDYDSDIIEGKYYIYRIFFPERCTLSLFQVNGDWYVDQVAGNFNGQVHVETRKKIENWRLQNGIFSFGDVFRMGIPPAWIYDR